MSFRSLAAISTLVSSVVLASCNSDPIEPVDEFRIEAIANVEDGTVVWDPNDAPVLYIHALGVSDDEAAQLVWEQSGLAIDDSGWRGPNLAITAGREGCGYGGVTFTITATAPDKVGIATITVRMERYVCSGSPWAGH